MGFLQWLKRFAIPDMELAHQKRRLEKLCRECGVSKTVACTIASKFFE